MEVAEADTGSSSPGGLSKDSASHASEVDSGIETMEVDDAAEKASEKRKRTSSRYAFPVWNTCAREHYLKRKDQYD